MINTKLLEQTAKQIEKHYLQFMMEALFTTHKEMLLEELNDGHIFFIDDAADLIESVPDDIPKCGTAACIAGWALSTAHKKDPAEVVRLFVRRKKHPYLSAQKVLGLNKDQAERLFHSDNWPEPFQQDYRDADESLDFKKKAKIAAARIRFFIVTNGKDITY